MWEFITNQLGQIHFPTAVFSIFSSSLITEVLDWFKKRNLQAKQAAHNAELEELKLQYQKEIQARYLQYQEKITSFYSVYPELHEAYKETEGLVYQLFHHSAAHKKEADKSWHTLNQKLTKHLLFLDKELEGHCIAAKNALRNALDRYDALDDKNRMMTLQKMSQEIDVVSNLMRARLIK